MVRAKQLRSYLTDNCSGRPGVRVLRELLEARDPAAVVPQSVFETRLLGLIKSASLPLPVTQYPITHAGSVVAVVDFAYPERKLAIEADGFRWHSGRRRWQHDLARRNRITLLGWRIIHVTWDDLRRRPRSVIDGITAALA